jgi:acetyltransferase-like isoleucine patch superfamily enzyme
MLNPVSRIIQRYFVPNLLVSAYYFARYQCIISSRSQVQLSNKIQFGKKTVVKPFSVINTHEGRVVIGRNCAISSFNHIATSEADVVIGNHVRTGPGVIIHGTRRNYKRADQLIIEQGHSQKGVTIGDDVLIGANAIVFECGIGTGAVIGAASVISNDVPPYAIVVGVPGKVIAMRE